MKLKKILAVSLLFFSFSFLVPTSMAYAIVLEGALGTNSYVASANGTPSYVWMKNSSSLIAYHSGNMSGKLQASLGIWCGHTYNVSLPAIRAKSMGKTWYVDNAHTILDVNFIWYMDGVNIESYSMNIASY